MTQATIRIAFSFVLLAGLAACGDEQASETSGDGRTAAGEVLGGTISDDMLPLPLVRSQSPPQRGGEGSGASGADSSTGEADASGAPEDTGAAEESEPEAADSEGGEGE